VRTVGDHLRKRRLDLGLRQRDVAEQVGVNKDTVRNWEIGRAAPALRQWPRIIRLLGYVPFEVGGDSLALSERLKTHRKTHGLSQRKLADLLEVDEGTVRHWERGTSQPKTLHRKRIETLFRRARPSKYASRRR